MAGTIYLVTNNLNGKQYVGQTIVTNNCVGHGKLMTRAYKKHGKDNFSYEPICTGIVSKSVLNYLERFWIRVMDTRLPNGYNIEHGGSSVDKIADETRLLLSAKSKGNKRRLGAKASAETKAKMSASKQNISQETRQKLSNAKKGRVLSEETKAKIALGNKGKIVSEETRAKLSASVKAQKAKQKEYL